jgi:hypothetical protein
MKIFFKGNGISKMFAGRIEEANSLIDSLKDGDGGTILISGDRGSGKSRLIKEATEKLKFKIFGNTFFLDKTINVEIPLITHAALGINDTEQQMLRGLLLRSIVHALWAEYTSKYWTRYRAVNYRRKLKKLVKRTEYSKIIRTLGVGGSIQEPQSGINSMIKKTWQGELDLSDIKLELYLTDLIKQYGRKYRFIIVFDELDKFEDRLTPTNYIENLKNFFTASSAHFIFVSTEDFYGQLQNRIQASSYSKEHTLFSKKILINQITPQGFSLLIDEMFEKSSLTKAGQDYELFKLALMWQTNLYPYDLKHTIDVLKNNSGDKAFIDIDNAKKYFNDNWEYHAPLLEIANYVYDLFAETKDSYYNRYLYKSLKEVLGILVTESELKFNLSNTLTALVLPEDFEGISPTYDAYIATGEMPAEDGFLNDWKRGLYSLTTPQVSTTERAILTFLWLCDKLNYTNTNKNTLNPSGYVVSLTLQDQLSFLDNKDNKYSDATKELDILEKGVEDEIIKLNKICQKMLGSAIESSIDNEILQYYVTRIIGASNFTDSTDGLRYRFKFSIKVITQKLCELHDITLVGNLASRLDEILMKEIATSSSLISIDDQIGKFIKMPLPKGGYLLVVFNLELGQQARFLEDNECVFFFTVIDIEAQEYVQSIKFKEYRLTKNWGNYETILMKIESKAHELRTEE